MGDSCRASNVLLVLAALEHSLAQQGYAAASGVGVAAPSKSSRPHSCIHGVGSDRHPAGRWKVCTAVHGGSRARELDHRRGLLLPVGRSGPLRTDSMSRVYAPALGCQYRALAWAHRRRVRRRPRPGMCKKMSLGRLNLFL